MDGDVYMITSPSGKSYIGQAIKFLPNGRRHGYVQRFKQHIYEAKTNKNFSVALDNALRKYNYEGFKLVLLKECPTEELNFWEQAFIKQYNTLTPNGYNLTEGGSNGKQSEATCYKRQQSMLGKNKGKVYPRKARLDNNEELPKYIRHYKDKSGKEGYRISNHPYLKDRSFLSKTFSMEHKLTLAMQYLQQADKSERFNE